MTNQEYLNALIAELMADTDWALPPQQRFFLVSDIEWKLLGL